MMINSLINSVIKYTMLIVTFKNDRNINRFPNKNVERSLAKNYSMSVTKN